MRTPRHTLAMILAGALALVATVTGPLGAQDIKFTTSSQTALNFFKAGVQLRNNLYSEASAEQFELAVQHDPRFAMAYLYLARSADSYAAYRDNLALAVELMGEASEGEQLLIRSYQARDENRPAEEEQLLRRLQALYPQDVDTHFHLAQVYFTNGDYRNAADQLETAIALNDEYPPAYNQLAYCYAYLGDHDAAIATLKAYASLIPDEPNPHDSLGEIYFLAGRYDDAADRYTRALEIDPTFYSSHTGLGHVHTFQGRAEEAFEEFDRMQGVAPTDGVRRDASRWRAISQIHFGDLDGAHQTLAEVRGRALAASEVVAAGNRCLDMAWVNIHRGHLVDALGDLEEGWQSVMTAELPETAKRSYARRHLVVRGVCDAEAGNANDARASAERLQRLVEQSADLEEWQDYNWLMGEILLQEEDYRGALANLMHGPRENPRVLYLVAVAFERRGEQEQANRHYAKVRDWNRPGLLYAMVRDAATRAID